MASFSLKLPPTVRDLVFTGLKHYLTLESRQGEPYEVFRSTLVSACVDLGPGLAKLVLSQFGPFLGFGPVDRFRAETANFVEIAGAVVAVAAKNGVSDNTAMLVGGRVCHYLMQQSYAESEAFDLSLRKWLFSVYADYEPGANSFLESVSWFVKEVRELSSNYLLIDPLFAPIINMMSVSGIAIYGVVDKLLELFCQAMQTFTGGFSEALFQYTSLGRAFLSVILPEGRRRAKKVWGILLSQTFHRLTKAEQFAYSLPEMHVTDKLGDYADWSAYLLRALEDTGLTDQALPYAPPMRKHRLPRNPVVSSDEVADLLPMLDGRHRTIPLLSKPIERMIAAGVPQGVDGAWFATPERLVASIDRYNVDRPVNNLEDLYLIRETAQALVDQYPDMYLDSEYLTVGAVVSNLKIKYSPGLPFIPHFRNRKELRDHGFIRAIAQVAKRFMEEGFHPGSFAHAFDKVDIVKLIALLAGKNIRTVIAQDLITSIIELCALGDTGKRLPPVDAWVMNSVPRTEAGFRPFYDELHTRKNVIQADAKEFDSKLGPLVFLEGLSTLRELGYSGTAFYPQVSSQIRAHYIAMAKAPIINLATGQQHVSTGGGMTGQVLTSTDNRDGFRLMIISAWARVTGRHPSDFFKTNTLGNAGDDDVWGSDDSMQILHDTVDVCRDLHGVEVLIEAVGLDNIDFVGLQLIPVPDTSKKWYLKAGLVVPSYSIRQEPHRLLMKKTEFKTTLSGAPDYQMVLGHIDSVIGSSALTAHSLDVYGDFASSYMDELEYLALRFFQSITWEVDRAEDGSILGAEATLGKIRPRYQAKGQSIQRSFQAWLRGHRFPSYEKVFNTWVVPNNKGSMMAKRHQRLLGFNPKIGPIERAMFGAVALRSLLWEYIPNHVVRAQPEFQGADISIVMKEADFTICKFVWLSLFEKHKTVPPNSLFITAFRENPYASAADPVSFLEWMAQPLNFESLIKTDLEQLRAQMCLIVLCYVFVEKAFASLKDTPILGLLVQIFALSTRDLNRLYALLNHIYMLATGRSSMVISNMMPPDPYAWVKQLAVIMSNVVPARLTYYMMPGLRHLVGIVPGVVEFWAAAEVARSPNVARTLYNLIKPPTSWENIVNQELTLWGGDPSVAIAVNAPTGTGKSTIHIGALWAKTNAYIWILSPTRTSVIEYDNPSVPSLDVQKLSKGEPLLAGSRIKVITYGQFLTRQSEVVDKSIFVFDEYHLCRAEQLSAWFTVRASFPKSMCLCLSATPPAGIFPRVPTVLQYEGARRFESKCTRTSLEFGDVLVDVHRTTPKLLSRVLIIVPTLASAQVALLTMERLSLPGTIVSATTPNVPTDGPIVATPIAETALTIYKPPTLLIDLGLTVEVKLDLVPSLFPNYVASIVPTGPSAHTQRQGRVGRLESGRAIVLGSGGLGSDPLPSPTAYDLLRSTSFLNELCRAYRISFRLKPQFVEVSELYGNILDYIIPHPALIAGYMGDRRAISNAYFLFIRMSSGVDLDEAIRECRNIYVGGQVEEHVLEIARLVVSIDLPEPGDMDMDMPVRLLRNGALQIQHIETLMPTTCLVIRYGEVLPCNYDAPQDLKRIFEVIVPSTGMVGLRAALTYDQWAAAGRRYEVDVEHSEMPHRLVEVEPFVCSRELYRATNRTMRYFQPDMIRVDMFAMWRINAGQRQVAEFFLQGENPWGTRTDVIIAKLDPNVNTPGGVNFIDFTRLYHLGKIDRFGLALMAASGLPDTAYVSSGKFPTTPEINDLALTRPVAMSQQTCLAPSDTFLISAKWSRRVIDEFCHVITGPYHMRRGEFYASLGIALVVPKDLLLEDVQKPLGNIVVYRMTESDRLIAMSSSLSV